MGSSTSKRCEGWFAPVLGARHGRPHEAQIPVSSLLPHDGLSHSRVSRQPGQTSTAEVSKLDLRAELLAAEAEARDKKRKAEGKPPLAVENGIAPDEEANKRRKLLQEALEMDKDDDDDDEPSEKDEGAKNDESKEGSDE